MKLKSMKIKISYSNIVILEKMQIFDLQIINIITNYILIAIII